MILTTSSITPVSQNGTLTFPYPAGKTASSFALGSSTLYVEGIGVNLSEAADQFDIALGASNVTVTYKHATPVPAGGRVLLDLVLREPDTSVRIVAASAVAQVHTGNTAETVLATITIPANAMGPNGRLRVTTSWSNNNNGNNKTARIRFGGLSGTIYFGWASTTNLALRDQREIMNRGTVNSQVGGFPTGGSAFGSAASAPVTSAIDTSQATTIVLTGQLADAGDTITLESYLVEVIVL